MSDCWSSALLGHYEILDKVHDKNEQLNKTIKK